MGIEDYRGSRRSTLREVTVPPGPYTAGAPVGLSPREILEVALRLIERELGSTSVHASVRWARVRGQLATLLDAHVEGIGTDLADAALELLDSLVSRESTDSELCRLLGLVAADLQAYSVP